MLKYLKPAILAVMVASPAAADTLGLGRAATPEEVAAWNIDVRPDGQGLPEGRGDVETGEEVFAEKCAICHGDFGEGVDRWPVLAGGHDTIASEHPVKTIGSYWPYLSTVWDYVHRAMPFGDAQSLTDDEVYAITAYLLYVNDLVEDDFELSHENFQETRLPNEENFFADDRTESPLWGPREACMTDCKPTVEITRRAAVVDVTPDETAAAAAEGEAKAEEAPAEEAPVEVAAAPALDEALVAKGKKVFKKCKSCHQVGDGAKNRSGPVLTAVIDAPAAAVEGFKYSKAMKAAAAEGLVWDVANLDQFLLKPKKFIKKTKMSFGGLKKDKDRAAIIEYLKSVAQ
ncbi:MAG: c-type cytochrome [Pikeienuella sp.]